MTTKLKYAAILLLAGAASAVFHSCAKDEGNYKYHDINEVAIAGIADSYTILSSERLAISPEITSTLTPGDANYEYRWIATAEVKKEDFPIVDTIGHSRELDYKVALPENNYKVTYRVLDKNTGVTFERPFRLRVQSSISEGYLIMNDIDGKMRLDMYSYRDGQFYPITDVLAYVDCELGEQEGPIKTVIFPDGNSEAGTAIYLLTRSGTNRIHSDTFLYKPYYNVSYHFASPAMCPEGFYAENMVAANRLPVVVMLGQQRSYTYYPTMTFWFGYPTNTYDKNTTHFALSKWLAADKKGSSGLCLAFDDDSKSLCYMSTWSYYQFAKLNDRTNALANTGKDLLFLGNFGTEDTFYAILKGADNACTFYSFEVDYMMGMPTFLKTKPISNSLDIHQADLFAVGGEFESTTLFYTKDNKLYRYNYGEGINAEMPLNQSGKQITYIGFRFLAMGNVPPPHHIIEQNLLTVAFYDPVTKKGTLEFYSVPQFGNIALVRSWEGFGKIVDVNFRARY